jgi:hypothetical protein
MKHILYTLGLSILLFSCQQKQETAITYTPRVLTATEKFNEYKEGADSVFTVYKNNSKDQAEAISGTEEFGIKFRDTIVRIQVSKADSSAVTDKFAYAQFINTQKTSLLVQIADHSGSKAPFYLIALKNGKLDVVSLYRPSTGKQDSKFTNGLVKIGRGGYLINNDFFITNVNAQAYLIKRQNSEERIQGEFIVNSPDKSTLIFLMANSLYEVHYPSDEVFIQPFSKPAPQSADVSEWVKDNFSWEKNKKGITFLKFSDGDRIVDIKEFS